MGNRLRTIPSLLVVLVIALLAWSSVYVNVLQAQGEDYTLVGGVIDTDTIWTLDSSPYFLTTPVLVSEGTTLTIEPGVTVCINASYIKVDGTLIAKGNGNQKIVLTQNDTYYVPLEYLNAKPAIEFSSTSIPWNEASQTGCILENTVISSARSGYYYTIKISNASPKISNSTITTYGDSWSIYVDSGSPIIANNTITSKYHGITVNSHSGVPKSIVSIVDNIIYGCEIGISIGSGSPVIERNLIINNVGDHSDDCGIFVNWRDNGNKADVPPVIKNNTIAKNSNGIRYASPYDCLIEYNNFYQNNQYNIYLRYETTSNITATNNWWGTIATSEINQTIYDFKNDFNLGKVNFVPFLLAPNPQAPTIPTYTIIAAAGNGGSISPSGSFIIAYGDSQVFNVTSDSGYQLTNVLIDGLPASAPYTVSNVVADGHTIIASFEQSPVSTSTPSPTPPSVIPEMPSLLMTAVLMLTVLGATVLTRKKKVN